MKILNLFKGLGESSTVPGSQHWPLSMHSNMCGGEGRYLLHHLHVTCKQANPTVNKNTQHHALLPSDQLC